MNEAGVFRLNLGVGKQTFADLFGVARPDDYDFTAFDKLMPHPVYGKMYWLCVLNPSATTFEAVRPLLAKAYERAAGKR